MMKKSKADSNGAIRGISWGNTFGTQHYPYEIKRDSEVRLW